MAGNAVKVGRYALGERIASGGMATVHLGRLDGSAGFSRTVAIKRLHPHLCEDPNFTGAFADEARLAARIRHPNVVPTLDVVSTEGELLIVMEYVDGDSLSSLVRSMGKERIPLPVVVAIVSEMLHGLHSAHEAKSETGKPLDIVHRDVSPQNVLVGADGVARLVDFGIARASSKNRQATTGENDLKGKLAYMAPEQIRRENVTRRTDIYAAGIVLWELLTGERLFASDNEAATMEKILVGWVQPPRTINLDCPDALNEIALRALDPDPNHRFETARDMAVALEDALGRALGREVGAWVEKTAVETLTKRRAMIARTEKANAPNATHTDLSSVAASVMTEAPTTPRHERFTKPKAMQPTVPDRPASRSEEPTTGPGFPSFEDTPAPAPAVLVPAVPVVTPVTPVTSVTPVTTLASASAPPLGMEYEPTITSFAELAQKPAPSTRSRTDRWAYAVFGLAVLITLVVGLSWSRITTDTPPAKHLPDDPPPLIVDPPADPLAEKTADKPIDKPADKPLVDRPIDKPVEKVDKPVGPATPWPAVRPVVRPRPRSSAPKQPCTSKLDPATGKTIYQGDCN